LLVNACQFILKDLSFFFEFFSLQKYFIKFGLKFIILVLDVLICNLNIFGSGIDSKLIECQIIISQLTLKISDFCGQGLKSFFELVIKLLFFVDGFCFVSEFLCFFLNVHHLLFYLGNVIISVINFSLSCDTLGTVDTATCCQWTLLNFDCRANAAQWV
jgi:hypothetical protein